ncbi:MAG: hypothetical protein PHE67_07785 [Campylobacterales bacterium]|nr:hypothetical protein [Campylobacterales bacterium]
MKKKLLLITIPFVLLAANGEHEREIALAYISGEKGATTETKDLPSCPYEKCDGMTQIEITKKDYIKAMEWLEKAINENNKDASVDAFKLLYKQIDYKSKRPDEYLLEMMKNNFNIDLLGYNRLISYYLGDMVKNKQCIGYYYSYEAYKNGYFGLSANDEKASEYKILAHKTCGKNTIYHLLSK